MDRLNPFVALDGKQYTSVKEVRIVNRGILLKQRLETIKQIYVALESIYRNLCINIMSYGEFITAYQLLSQLEKYVANPDKKYYSALINADVICITIDEDQEVSKIKLELQAKIEERSQGRN